MAKQIVWKDLEKRLGLFTVRNAAMLDLNNGSKIQYYSANTKINLAQETELDGTRYLRTESAMTQGLDWAFKASDFGLPELKVASLEPSKESFVDNNIGLSTYPKHSTVPKNKNVSKSDREPKSEVGISDDKKNSIITAFKRFFRRDK